METVVGLSRREGDVQHVTRELEEKGFGQDSIDMLTRGSRKRLADECGHPVVMSAGLSGAIGIAIYVAYSLGAALTGCTSCQYDSAFVVGTLMGCAVIGGFVGALLR
jgi:hypothetical protein